MFRNLRPLVSKAGAARQASLPTRSIASTASRSLATPTIEGRSSPVRAHSVEECVAACSIPRDYR